MATQIRRGPNVYKVDWYIAVHDGEKERKGVLAGPYDTHNDAEADKQAIQRCASQHDQMAHWYSYGLASSPTDHPLKAVLGTSAEAHAERCEPCQLEQEEYA